MTLETIGLVLVVLLPFLGAGVVAYMAKFHRLVSAWGAGFFTIGSIVILSQLAPIPLAGETLVQSWVWIESIGLNFSFRLDGLGMLFAYIILVIGFFIIFYARYYLSHKDCMGRFYSYLLLFMGSMVGIVFSENILQLVLFWELTSLSSFLLISFWQHKKEGRDGAMMALVVTGAGGLALFASMLLLGHVVGSYELSVVLESRDIITSSPLFTPVIILLLLGVLTKSAQFPFHFWLPHAMAAPTPVSAYLHSATMVKAGIFLLARFFPVFSGTPEWMTIVITAGMATMLIGAFFAFFKHDLKGLLAYSTISHLGLITLLFGLSTPLAALAAIFHIINHATFKASLFMVTGIVDHEAGTRDLRRLGGIFAFMPYTATLAMIGAAAMAGVPILNGFLSKEMFLERILVDGGVMTIILPILATLGAIFSVAYSIRFVYDVFFGKQTGKLDKTPHEPPRAMKIPVEILVIACFVVGIIPMTIVAPILSVAVMSSLQSAVPEYKIAIWHGFNIPLLMSFISFSVGTIVYIKKEYLFKLYDKYLSAVDARIPYNWLLDTVFSFANRVHNIIHKGTMYNSTYLLLAMSLIVGFVGFGYAEGSLLGPKEFLPVDPISVIITMLLVISTLAVLYFHRQRLIALVIIGVIGLIISLIFIKFSAPDLALTQLSVEIVTIVLILLALYYLPPFGTKDASKTKIKADIALATLGGLGSFVLTLAVLSREFKSISEFFLANSIPGGGGSNAVNVILVDFRGLDTFGEIVVLGIAGIGIFAVLQGLRLYAPTHDARGMLWSSDSYPIIMQTLMRLLLPAMLLVAIYIFLRGHNLPGGGFIAGLIAAIALIVQYLANGIEWTSKRLNFDKHFLVGSGVIVAAFTGVVSMFLDYPLLTSTYTYLDWPIVGKFPVSSALAFDLGVFLVVVGATVMILVQIGKVNTASHKFSKKTEDIEEIKDGK